MATQNPFSEDEVKGGVWEEGYLAGFNEPSVDHFGGPLAPELHDVYRTGETAGRDDRNGVDGVPWVGPDIDLGELPEHVGLHVLGAVLEKIGVAAGGLISLVLTVLFIPGDTELHPLEDDWSGPSDQDGDTYAAICPRSDHPMVIDGVTNDGYWVGSKRTVFVDAATDMKVHGHAEAFVARCSLAEKTCGPVWAVQ